MKIKQQSLITANNQICHEQRSKPTPRDKFLAAVQATAQPATERSFTDLLESPRPVVGSLVEPYSA